MPSPLLASNICRTRVPGPRVRSLAYAITPWHNFTIRVRSFSGDSKSSGRARRPGGGLPWLGQCWRAIHTERVRRRSGWERSRRRFFRISLASRTSPLPSGRLAANRCTVRSHAFTRRHARHFNHFYQSNLHLVARSYGRAVTKVDVADATMRALSRRCHLRRSRPFQIIILVGGYHFTFRRVSSPDNG